MYSMNARHRKSKAKKMLQDMLHFFLIGIGGLLRYTEVNVWTIDLMSYYLLEGISFNIYLIYFKSENRELDLTSVHN